MLPLILFSKNILYNINLDEEIIEIAYNYVIFFLGIYSFIHFNLQQNFNYSIIINPNNQNSKTKKLYHINNISNIINSLSVNLKTK